MQPSPRSAAAGPGREPGDIVGRADRVREPGEPVGRVLPRVGEDPLRHVPGVAPGPELVLDEARHRERGVRPHAGVVVHMQDPDVSTVLLLTLAELMSVMVGARLELGSVGRAVPPGYGDRAG